jgi:2,4-diaminopentanoate dehydrogenase
MRSTTGKAYKIMVWTTGGVGRYAIRTAADRPNLEFVGHGLVRPR